MKYRTKDWIAENMKELMVHKPIDKIRVTELCRKAGIERPTFYYHFQDKYDLVAWIFTEGERETDVISVDSAARSLEGLKKNYTFYKRAYEQTSQNALWEYMHEYYVRSYEAEAKKKLGVRVLNEQLKFSIRLYCYGAVWMTRQWVLYDNKTPAKTEVQMMFDSMPESLRAIYFI